jgi:ketol-acid reductoisomerase
LSEDKALSFSHGAAIHWKWIEPPGDIDIIMVAPKGPGQMVRELYQEGFGTPSLVAVHQDRSKEAWKRVLHGEAIGSAALFKQRLKKKLKQTGLVNKLTYVVGHMHLS